MGIVSDILIDGSKLSEYKYTVGLSGEQLKLSQFPARFMPKIESKSTNEVPTWFQSTFTSPENTSPALAVDFTASAAKKGAVWVNGFMLGRYWDITAREDGCQDSEQCKSQSYTGAYAEPRCRTGCGERSQVLYKIPLGVLRPVGR